MVREELFKTGNLSMKEKRRSEGDPCFLSWKYWVSAKQGQITGFLYFDVGAKW